MKIMSAPLLLLASLGPVLGQDGYLAPEETGYAVPSVVYEAPVFYQAPVVYQMPVVYYAPVYYLTAAAVAGAPCYPPPACAGSAACETPSTLVIIGGGGSRVVQNYGERGSTVFHFGGQQAAAHGYRFGHR